ncbi:thioredoxin-like protein, partial [Panaeolus papilionaceus]
YADIEALVLSGELFNGPERSSSPTRSVSPDSDPGWHDEELQSEKQRRREQGLDYDSDEERRDLIKAQSAQQGKESIGMGPGRTGVKGVIRDRDEAVEMQREKRNREIGEMNKKMEGASLGGKTFLEEEREKAFRGEKVDEFVRQEIEQASERRDAFGNKKEGRFGHLREVGVKGFVAAVEKEQTGIWVVVHLYDPSLERCYLIDEVLAQLARSYPETKFLRAKASALGFASKGGPKPKPARRALKPYREEDEDDPFQDKFHNSDDDEDDDERNDEDESDNVDLDMLPTMLVYRDGELVYNWVRVDWDAGEGGLQEWLDKHHILPQERYGLRGNLGIPSDDEDFD